MERVDRTPSTSQLFCDRFFGCNEMSSTTKIALAALSMVASVYLMARSMDADIFSIDPLVVTQRFASAGLLVLGLFLAISAALYRGAKPEKVKGAESLLETPEIPFKDELPPWLLQTIADSKWPCSFKKLEAEPYPDSSFKDIPSSIIFFTGGETYGIYLKLQIKHTDPEMKDHLSDEDRIYGMIWKSKSESSNWKFLASDVLNRALQDRELLIAWNPTSSDKAEQPEGVSDLDAFEARENPGTTSPLDWMLYRLLTRQECRILETTSSSAIQEYWSLSLAESPSSSSSSSS